MLKLQYIRTKELFNNLMLKAEKEYPTYIFPKSLLTTSGNYKADKTNKLISKYLTAFISLKPYKTTSGLNNDVVNLCPDASPGCIKVCLQFCGMNIFKNAKQSKLSKTRYFYDFNELYMLQLALELYRFRLKALKLNKIPAIRLNGYSDIDYNNIDIVTTNNDIFNTFHDIQFYDYTKQDHESARGIRYQKQNYNLVLSYKETYNPDMIPELIKIYGQVAVVFRNELPSTYKGLKVVNGDIHDLYFLYPKDVIIGLKAKGNAVHDTSGFVLD